MDDIDGEEIYDISEGQRATGNDNADIDANDLDEVRNMLEVMRGGVVEDATIIGDVLQKIHGTFQETEDSMKDQRTATVASLY